MSFFRNGPGRRMTLYALCAALALSLVSCGKNGGKEEEKLPEWTYIPEFVEPENAEDISWYEALLAGDDLYYCTSDWRDEKATTSCHRWSMTDGSVSEVKLALEEGENLNQWCVAEDGGVCAVAARWNYDEATQTSRSDYALVKYDAGGNQVFRQDITSLFTDEYAYINGIAVDGEGRIYLCTDDQVLLFDAEGNRAGEVKFAGMQSYPAGFGAGKDGKVYMIVTSYGDEGRNTALSQVDFETKSLSGEHKGYPSGNSEGTIAQDENGGFLAFDSVSVYRYDPETEQKEKLFDWLDCDINGNYVRQIGILSDGRVAAIYDDWNSGDSGLALLTRKKTSEVVRKQQIVLGAIYSNSDLQDAAVKFNKSSDTYHVQIRYYMSDDSWSDTSYEDAISRLNNDITSGNCPDIIVLDGLNVELLAAKGVFEDLSPMLESSEVLDRSNMIEGVLDAYTMDGILTAIPNTVSLQTMVGASSKVGDTPGWTLEEMIALADANPDADLFYNRSRQEMLTACLQYNIDSFIDWDTGSCSFDGEEFQKLLAFVARFPDADDITWDADAPSEPEMIQDGKVLLTEAYIYELDEMQLYFAMFGEDITAVGYPNPDGNNGCILSANGCCAITSKSKVKDGAWEFIESSLSGEGENSDFGFPNNRSRLEQMVEDELNVEYIRDADGELVLDENGDPIPEGGSHGIGYGNWEYYYRVPTREEVDMILDLLEGAQPVSGGDTKILSIINEEAEAFFQGQKSAKDVADIIQSRVNVYVNENR